MKSKTIVIITLSVILIVGGLFAWNANQKFKSNKVAVEPMGDGKGIFVGERRPQYKESDPSKWSPETRKRVEEYEGDVKAIHESWEISRQGDAYFKMGRYDEAIEAYKKAYELGKGDESFFGKELLKAYEKLQRYDEALTLLDELEAKKYYTSESGIKKAQEIRTRLLSAKSQASAK